MVQCPVRVRTQIDQQAAVDELVAAETPLGPEQAAARLRVRRVVFGWMVRLGTVDGHPLPTAAREPCSDGRAFQVPTAVTPNIKVRRLTS